MREEMIAMAREAGCVEPSHPFNPWSVSQEALERFAASVIAVERERCAKVCEEMDESFVTIYGTDYTDFQNDPRYLQMAAEAIRKGE